MSGRLVMVGEASARGDSAVMKAGPPKYDDLHYQRVKRMRRQLPDSVNNQINEFLRDYDSGGPQRRIQQGQARTQAHINNIVADFNRSQMHTVSSPAKRPFMSRRLAIGLGAGAAAYGAGMYGVRRATQGKRRNVRKRAPIAVYPKMSIGRIPSTPLARVTRSKPKRKLTREQYDRAMQAYRYRNSLSRNVPVGISGSRVVPLTKALTTMSENDAARIARKYGTKGPLPKGLSRDQRMKAYEGRYVASGGPKGEKWQRRVERSEVGRNAGLAGATLAGAAFLASRGRKTGPAMRRTKMLRGATPRRLENAGVASAVGGGLSELYGEHARSRRASYRHSPAGVAGSALTRMRAYTPDRRTT